MEENVEQNNTRQQPDPPPTPVETTPLQEETTSGSNNRITNIVEWLNRNIKVCQLVINFILMLATILMFWKASSQSEAAKNAATAAQEAVKEYRAANKISDSNLQQAKKSFEGNIIENQARVKRDSILFDIQNQPFIECVINTINPVEMGKPIDCTYSILIMAITLQKYCLKRWSL